MCSAESTSHIRFFAYIYQFEKNVNFAWMWTFTKSKDLLFFLERIKKCKIDSAREKEEQFINMDTKREANGYSDVMIMTKMKIKNLWLSLRQICGLFSFVDPLIRSLINASLTLLLFFSNIIQSASVVSAGIGPKHSTHFQRLGDSKELMSTHSPEIYTTHSYAECNVLNEMWEL